MQPVRQILNNAPEAIPIPPEFRHQRFEVIFWLLSKTTGFEIQEEPETIIDEVSRLVSGSPSVELGEFSLDLTGFHFDREEANARVRV